jgi:hypothetical protein
MKSGLSEFSLRYLIVRELSQLPTFRSGFAFELSGSAQPVWKQYAFRLRSKFDLQARLPKA